MPSSPIGSNFDDFLREEGLLEEVEARAIKRVLVLRLREQMQRQQLSVSELSRRMETSRTVVRRLLDPEDPALTLRTLTGALSVLGLRVDIQVSAVESANPTR